MKWFGVLVGFLFVAFQVSAHEHSAAHHGALIVLGQEMAHVELVVDALSGKLDAYILDGEAENPLRIHQESLQIQVKGKPGLNQDFSVKLMPMANVLTGETLQSTSQFSTTNPRLIGVTDFDGTIEQVNIQGQEFAQIAFNYPNGNETNDHDTANAFPTP